MVTLQPDLKQPTARSPAIWKSFALYLLACLTVIGFVNLYSLYRIVAKSLGKGVFFYAPLILPPVLLVLIFIILRPRLQRQNIRISYVLAGLLLLGAGLMVPDPGIAVKRIHVTEYLLLALLIRYTMARHLSGLPLLVFSCLATTILGIHDEFLQGIHPLRTYGLKDMLVNCLGACGGNLLWHGMGIFAGMLPAQQEKSAVNNAGVNLYLGWLLISLVAMAVPLTQYLNGPLPMWPFLPLATVPLYWSLLQCRQNSCLRHGVTACTGLTLPFFCYPVLINVLALTFY